MNSKYGLDFNYQGLDPAEFTLYRGPLNLNNNSINAETRLTLNTSNDNGFQTQTIDLEERPFPTPIPQSPKSQAPQMAPAPPESFVKESFDDQS